VILNDTLNVSSGESKPSYDLFAINIFPGDSENPGLRRPHAFVIRFFDYLSNCDVSWTDPIRNIAECRSRRIERFAFFLS